MDEHAMLYNEAVRKMTTDVYRISKNTGYSVEDIQKIKEHMFINKYELGGEEPERFDPDYDQARSWQRMIEGKDIHEMDYVLINHELTEYRLMHDDGLTYFDAHVRADTMYGYMRFVKELNLKEGIV
jgi:hypothetical protein